MADSLNRATQPLARQLPHLIERLGEKYQVDELDAKYEFTGRTPMSIDEAIDIKEELETIDKLLEQLREAMENATVGIIGCGLHAGGYSRCTGHVV